MSSKNKRGKKTKGKNMRGKKTKKLQILKKEIEDLKARIEEEVPPLGYNPLSDDKKDDGDDENDGNQLGPVVKKEFSTLPISKATLKGLKQAKYTKMTKIQQGSIIHSLYGRDILAAAKTGSGKTLAFLVPVIELLYRLRWSMEDGLGALIISPTRELSLQIFQVLQKIGSFHKLSAGLVIGGKKMKEEIQRISRMNIIVCTPGRILQHIHESPSFQVENLKVLVLDEADRILDMGFAKTIDSIIREIPKNRQTLLFSATQTKNIKTLARLSLNVSNTQYISVDEESTTTTPKSLSQYYMIIELDKKLDLVWSFIRSHLKNKILVFFSSCKQVKFVYETFRLMRPGVTVLSLHGKINQMKRFAIYETFSSMDSCVLFATDIAARGLDFPSVDWVIQVDCPEDVDSYIHRVGRTARYNSSGNALLLLNSSENRMVDLLTERKIPLTEIKPNPKKQQSIVGQLQGLLSKDAELKYLAQKSFSSYIRSVYLNTNKDVFKVDELPIDDYAASLGLIGAPKIRYVKKKNKLDKNISHTMKKMIEQDNNNSDDNSDDDDDISNITNSKKDFVESDKHLSKNYKLKFRKNGTVFSDHYSKLRDNEDNETSELFTFRRKDHDIDNDDFQLKIKKNKKKKGKIIKFDEDGNIEDGFNKDISTLPSSHNEYISKISKDLTIADEEDKKYQKQKLKEKRLKRKLSRYQEYSDDDEEEETIVYTLGGGSDDDDESEEDEDDLDVKNNKKRKLVDFLNEEDEEIDVPPKKKQKVSISELSLQEQEELALSLLNN